MRLRRPYASRERSVDLPEEVIEALRDDPGLLAVADAIRATQGTRRPRTVAARFTLVAAVVAIAAVLALLAPWQAHGTDVIRRAAQAAGNGRLLQLTVKTGRPVRVGIDPRSGRIVRAVVVVSAIYDRQTMRLRAGVRVTGGRQPLPAAKALAATVSDFVVSYRRALDMRQAAVTRRSGGLIWIRLKTTRDIRDVGLDPKTYRPVRLRVAGAGSTGGLVLDVVRFFSTGS